MIHLTDVEKYFGDKRALGPVSVDIPRGSTVGFLGLNGVGKTTLLRILACDLRPTAGSVRVAGFDALAEPHEVRKHVGYLPENPPVYPDMTVRDYLAFVGRLKGLSRSELPRRVSDVVERAHLGAVFGELIRHLSHGYRQRVGVAQAIIHDPDLLILDEPTNGLDPVQIVEMRALIQELTASHTILISSHILPEISQTCDQILVLNAGEVIASGSEDDLSARLLQAHRIVVSVVPALESRGLRVREALTGFLSALPGVTGVELLEAPRDTLTFLVESDEDCRALVSRSLVEAGHEVVGLERSRRELEGLFVELVGEAVA